MANDIIQLLPENIANQIAAGEVIQRPASAVKELLENAVDAGATEIKLVAADAGKSLIQVIDNGKGMSETDARMCFERHATSKIKQIDDLFAIRTMGFRGEALASIAAVSCVTLKTKRAEDELGTCIEIENSIVQKQELCTCATGTNIAMKNLFFNIPARRNFLKSNSVELRHIIEEFLHVALAFPPIFFSFTHNAQPVFYLEAGSLKQRILQTLGTSYKDKLIPVKEETDYMLINGFIGKPETARKTRGEQYFFVNNRFIKSPYLNHAVASAFENILPKDSFPLYVLNIEIAPAEIDVNVHPAKQEIKFEDEKIVYAFVQAAVKHALAHFSVTPSLDFSLNADIQQLEAIQKPFSAEQQEATTQTPLFQTFTKKHQAHIIEPSLPGSLQPLEAVYKELIHKLPEQESSLPIFPETVHQKISYEWKEDTLLLQLHNTYILAPATSGFLIVHQQLAHEIILYEQFQQAAYHQKQITQEQLFPSTLHLSASDSSLLNELLPELKQLGFHIEPFGVNTFIIHGTPPDLIHGNHAAAIELLIEQMKFFQTQPSFEKREQLMKCLARQQAIKAGQPLSQSEMQHLLSELFQCAVPAVTPSGNTVFIEVSEADLIKMFSR